MADLKNVLRKPWLLFLLFWRCRNSPCRRTEASGSEIVAEHLSAFSRSMISSALVLLRGCGLPTLGLRCFRRNFSWQDPCRVLCNPILKRRWRRVDSYLSRTVRVECTPAPEPGTKDRILIQSPSVFQWWQECWLFWPWKRQPFFVPQKDHIRCTSKMYADILFWRENMLPLENISSKITDCWTLIEDFFRILSIMETGFPIAASPALIHLLNRATNIYWKLICQALC